MPSPKDNFRNWRQTLTAFTIYCVSISHQYLLGPWSLYFWDIFDIPGYTWFSVILTVILMIVVLVLPALGRAILLSASAQILVTFYVLVPAKFGIDIFVCSQPQSCAGFYWDALAPAIIAAMFFLLCCRPFVEELNEKTKRKKRAPKRAQRETKPKE